MSITFELGSVLEKQKKFADAEAAFRQVIAQEPEHGPALNYLGYMLAERGERLTESVDLIKRALQTEPDNGSYLDSLGWAYFKDGKFDLALDPLRRAADQLLTNSVVQDHYGDVLFRLGRFDEAIAAWSRALAGDREDVDEGGIDRKIRSARQKLPRR
jgi:tetratricopeptide (TPR) repeat protein